MRKTKEFTFDIVQGTTANTVETFFHNVCDTHGWTNCDVRIEGNTLILSYDTDNISHSAVPGPSRLTC